MAKKTKPSTIKENKHANHPGPSNPVGDCIRRRREAAAGQHKPKPEAANDRH